MITGFDFVALPAQDLDRATAFYRDVIGLTPGERAPGQFIEFDLPDGNTLSLIDRRAWQAPGEPDRRPVKAGSVVLAVDDVDAALARMRELGLTEQTAPNDFSVCQSVMAHDTEGNSLALHRRKKDPGVAHALDFVALPVADVKRAKAFYHEMFGLVPGDFDNEEGFVEYDIPPNTALVLGKSEGMGIPFEPATGGAVALGVDDLDAVFAKFKAKGLAETPAPFETPVCFMAPVLDSEGNALILHKRKRRA